MEISAKKGRGRPRKYPRDESAQPSAFPEATRTVASERIEEDAKEKEGVKKAVEAIPEIFTPDGVKWVFDVYVGLISFIYSLLLKVDFKEINDELKFEEDQKDQLAIPLAKILSKHAPASWAGSTAEIQLITMMGVWTVASFQRARNVQRKAEEAKKAENRTRPVAPIQREPSREIHVPA